MSSAIASILRHLERFESTEASAGLELRTSLTKVILKQLQRKRWTQSRLAEAAGMKEPFISRILHSDANCTLDTVGKLLHALGIRAEIREIGADTATTINRLTIQREDTTDEKTLRASEDSTGTGYRIIRSAQIIATH